MVHVSGLKTIADISGGFFVRIISMVVEIECAGSHDDNEATGVLDPCGDPKISEEHEKGGVEVLFGPFQFSVLRNQRIGCDIVEGNNT